MSIVISSAVRTPIGSLQGSLASLKASELGAVAVKEAVQRAKANASDIDLILMGNVLSAGMGQAPARQAAIYAGLGENIPATMLNKMCGSGLEAIIQGVRALQINDATVTIAGGMESMSNAPYLIPGVRSGLRMGHKKLVDSMIVDGLWDVYNDKHMGSCADMCASKYSISREEQDAFAIASYERANEAMQKGYSANEIITVELKGRKGEITLVGEDEGPKAAKYDKIPTLKPAFEKDGTVTAANASSVNDGASALVMTTATTAQDKGLNVLAEIKGYSSYAHAPEWFTTAPVAAMQKLLKKLSWTVESVDLFEINEAFSVVVLAAMKELSIPHDKVNVHGGAVALGHPIGASGARIVTTLIHALKQGGKKRGVAAICIGGGEALALGLELTP
ncbi:MAG: thiolase family protein [Trueperaceae bacterium]